MACIYEDTASHGVKNGKQYRVNRLVAQITVNGKQRRKRGYNYNELRAWLDEQIKEVANTENSDVRMCADGVVRRRHRTRVTMRTIKRYLDTGRIRGIIGFSRYAVDTVRGKVYNVNTGCMVNAQRVKRMNCHQVRLCDNDNVFHHLSLSRLRYAVDNSINPLRIPQGFMIDNKGEVKTYADVLPERMAERKEKLRQRMLDDMLRELTLMREYYQTLDIGPVELYLAGRRNHIVVAFAQKWGRAYAGDLNALYDNATYRILNLIEQRGSLVTRLSGTVLKAMERMVIDARKTKSIDDMNYGRGL